MSLLNPKDLGEARCHQLRISALRTPLVPCHLGLPHAPPSEMVSRGKSPSPVLNIRWLTAGDIKPVLSFNSNWTFSQQDGLRDEMRCTQHISIPTSSHLSHIWLTVYRQKMFQEPHGETMKPWGTCESTQQNHFQILFEQM